MKEKEKEKLYVLSRVFTNGKHISSTTTIYKNEEDAKRVLESYKGTTTDIVKKLYDEPDVKIVNDEPTHWAVTADNGLCLYAADLEYSVQEIH